MSETTQDTLTRLTAFINQNYSDVETGPGSVISELLLKLAASIQNPQYNQIAALAQSSSIAAVLADSADTYSEVIDKVASNYNTKRSGGAKVRGKVKVTVASSGEFNFREGFIFTQPALGLNYLVLQNTSVSPKPSAILGEIQLYAEQGLYYFILDVEAEAVGANYQLSSGTNLVVPEKYYIRDFVRAEAYGNFSSGAAPDTDKQLVAKIKNTLGHSRLVSPLGIANRFRETFAGFQSLSVCGANDPEMTRSKHNILGISTHGKADVYVRSSLGLETLQITKPGTKISSEENLWQIAIDHLDAPGFYYIQSIIPKVTNISIGGTLVIDNVSYGYSAYYNQRNNELASIAEARYTKYQTAVVTFRYEAAPGVTAADFELHLLGQPNILEMQNLLLLDEERLACSDYLVRAVTPCLVSLNIKLVKKNPVDTYESLNLQQLKKDIFNYINSIPFGEQLYASAIVNICHNYNIRRVELPVKMLGQILAPNGTLLTIENTDVLTIPYDLGNMVTPKTTAYFIDYYRLDAGVANPIDNIGLNIS